MGRPSDVYKMATESIDKCQPRQSQSLIIYGPFIDKYKIYSKCKEKENALFGKVVVWM